MAADSTWPIDAIRRDPTGFSRDSYDLIIVGGGIYGTMLTLEAVRRGLSCLLLERDDFGGHTSYNHLRILHGGLRYLQRLDLARFRDSISERSWFLRHFPHLTSSLECLLPLYGRGLRRPGVFRVALALDAFLAPDRNHEVPESHRLRAGRVLSADEAFRLFPDARAGLKGAALWQDGFAPDSPRLVIELLRWACAHGARHLNYCPVESLSTRGSMVSGVMARDKVSGQEHEFLAPVVINAAGPWCREFASVGDRDRPELFPQGVLVWNLLFDRPSLASCAVAVSPPHGEHVYFMPPWKGRLLIGTGHVPLAVGEHRPPDAMEIAGMIADLNAAVPGLDLTLRELRRVFWGVMPGDSSGRLGSRPVFVDHGIGGGPVGFFSLSGPKFTTARSVADNALKRIFPSRSPRPYGRDFLPGPDQGGRGLALPLEADGWRALIQQESVVTLGDLVFRRTDICERSELDAENLNWLAALFPWDACRRRMEAEAVRADLDLICPGSFDT